MNTTHDISLLINGAEAFPQLLRCIAEARRTLEVHIFLWRADRIGMAVAEAVLAAAQRGVQVTLTADRYALLLEGSEESGVSFFHGSPTPAERLKIGWLRFCYRLPIRPCVEEAAHRDLLERLLRHPNIRVSRHAVLADHSKYCIIDDRILFLGGINIEDKENGCDLSGRAYYDYMVKLSGQEPVEAFRAKLERGADLPGPCRFVCNCRQAGAKRFEMEEHYLSVIRGAKRELTLVMGYFSLTPPFLAEITAAVQRGVQVTLLLSARANFQNDSNLRSAALLLRRCGGGLRLFLSPKMVHAKLVCSESRLSLGSCNITPRAFRQLCELNLELPNTDTPFCRRLAQSVAAECALSRRVERPDQLSYRPFLGWIESILC